MVSAAFIKIETVVKMSLNPYYTGRWFLLSIKHFGESIFRMVLILIILEDGFCSIVFMDAKV